MAANMSANLGTCSGSTFFLEAAIASFLSEPVSYILYFYNNRNIDAVKAFFKSILAVPVKLSAGSLQVVSHFCFQKSFHLVRYLTEHGRAIVHCHPVIPAAENELAGSGNVFDAKEHAH